MDAISNLCEIVPEKIKYNLDKTYQLLKVCGNPEKKITTIQIIGTNGKGSTAAFIVNILKNSKHKIGLYTSPHLINPNERIRINFKPIATEDINFFLNIYKNQIKTIKPSFFEIMTVMALWYFKRNNIKIAVLEAGLGGRLDSTTACLNQYLVFTSISMDHKEILGNTIRKISQEKAAAINSSNQHCIAKYDQNNIINETLKAQAKKHNSSIYFIKTQNNDLQLKYLKGEHQKENALLAIHLVRLLEKQDILKVLIDKIPLLIFNTKWPGRFQEVSSYPKIIFDVCHNADSIKMFHQNIIKKHSSSKKYLICGFEYNKEIKEELFNIAYMFKVIICTETNHRKSMKVSQLKTIFNNSSVKIECIIDPQKAINKAIQYCKKKDEIYIIGSHFFGPFIDTKLKNCFAID